MIDDLFFDSLKNEAYRLGKNDAWEGGISARTFLTLFDYLGVSLDSMSEAEAGVIWDCYNEGFDDCALAASYDEDKNSFGYTVRNFVDNTVYRFLSLLKKDHENWGLTDSAIYD